MRCKRWSIAVVAATVAGVAPLSSCVTNVDVPATFAATVTITGEADEVWADSGECVWVDAAHLFPGYVVSISAGAATTTSSAPLKVESIGTSPRNGAGTCTYTAYFEAIAANQAGYELWVSNNVRQQSFTADQLKSGPTYRLEGADTRSGR